MNEHGLCGTQFDRYSVRYRIGGGGFGDVYYAEHTITARAVALKVLAMAQRTPNLLERFLRESRSMTAIGSAHIAQVFDAGTSADGRPFLALEFIDGCSLAELVDAQGTLELGRALRITLQVLDALEAAHAAGVVHRDIKPANIMLDGTIADGSASADFVKLVDFGISKAFQEGTPSITRTGAVLGTPGYASPEQYMGSHAVDARSDIYSTAVVVYHMLARRLPFEATTYERMVLQVCTQDAPTIGLHAPWLSPELAAVIDRGLSRNIETRWQTVREFADAIRGAAPDVAASLAASPPRAPIRASASSLAPRAPLTPLAQSLPESGRASNIAATQASGPRSLSHAVTTPAMAPVPLPVPAITSPSRSRFAVGVALGVVGALVIGGLAVWLVPMLVGGDAPETRDEPDETPERAPPEEVAERPPESAMEAVAEELAMDEVPLEPDMVEPEVEERPRAGHGSRTRMTREEPEMVEAMVEAAVEPAMDAPMMTELGGDSNLSMLEPFDLAP
jgi:serine/threonine protein kinase